MGVVYPANITVLGLPGFSYINYVNAQQAQGSNLNAVLVGIDEALGQLFNSAAPINSSEVSVYDGPANFCLDVQYPAGSLNDVLQYIGGRLCSLYTSSNGGGSTTGADPLNTHGLPVNSPGYVYPVLPTVPASLPLSTYVYPPVAGILNYNPSDITVAGHLEGIIGALDFADHYAKIRPDYEYVRATIQGLCSNFVSTVPSTGTLLLSLNLGSANYYISGRRIYVAGTAVPLTAFSDNYIDVNIDGAYINNLVPNGNPVPIIAANTQRLLKVITNGTIATSVVDLMVLEPYGNSLLQDQAVDARVIKDKNVGPTQLADTAVTPGTYDMPTITIDQQGRITAVSGNVFNIVAPADKDILQYNLFTNKFVNVPVAGSILPTGNDGDLLRYDAFTNDWYSASVFTPIWTKYTVVFSDFQPSSNPSQSINLAVFGEGSIIVGYKIKHSASFTGGLIDSALIKILDGATDYSGGGFNVFQGPTSTRGKYNTGFSGASIPTQDLLINLNAQLIVTTGVMDDLVSGSVDIWIGAIQLV